jgi:hypothetical protein
VRPTAAGTILDASALLALPRSIYARTLVDVSVRERRPLVIPATSLYIAALGGAEPADFDTTDYTVTALAQAIVPGMLAIARAATGPLDPDLCHVAWEATVTGYPVLTDNPGPYAHLSIGIDLDLI